MKQLTNLVEHVVIAGAGIGGLALGIALRRVGVRVTIAERAPRADPRGSGLVLAPNGVKAIDSLGADVGAAVRAAGSVAGGSQTGHRSAFTTDRGKLLAEISFDGTESKWGVPIVSLLRARLSEVLGRYAQQLGAEVRFGCAASGYQEDAAGVTLLVKGGESITGDLLVGADGLRSAVRSQLLGDGPPSYCGYTAVRGVGPRTKAYPFGFIAYGRGLILFSAPVDETRLYWVASMLSPEGVWPPKGREQAHSDLLLAMSSWDPAIAEVVLRADAGECLVTDIYDRVASEQWYGGRVALLGDAIHPMVYTMGQGANTALEDAVVLAHELTHATSLEAALSSYQAQREPRTTTIAKQSRMMGSMGHTRNPVMGFIRNTMFRVMSKFADFDKQNAPVFGWTAPGVGGAGC